MRGVTKVDRWGWLVYQVYSDVGGNCLGQGYKFERERERERDGS